MFDSWTARIVLALGFGLVFINLLVGFDSQNPSATNIGANLRKAVMGK